MQEDHEMKRIAVLFALSGLLLLSGCTDTNSTSQKNYVANRNSGKLHSISCDSLPYEKNRIYFETVEQAHAAGYTDHHKECMNEAVPVSGSYIVNKNNGKLHSARCDSLPAEHNRIYYDSVAQANAAGYTDKHRECMGN